MSAKNIRITDTIEAYCRKVSLREHPVLTSLREYTSQLPMSNMQIAPEQGQLIQMIVQLISARRTLEVGVFTGYSTLATALALPADGEIIACDVSEEWTNIAKNYWHQAQVAEKIKLTLAPAAETLDQLVNAGAAGSFDFAFIDADKTGYATYYEQCLTLLRPGGLMMLDNTLFGGAVCEGLPELDSTPHQGEKPVMPIADKNASALHELNKKLHQDPRIDLCLLPIIDGITLVRKHT